MGHRYLEQPGAGLFHSTNMPVERLVLQSEPRTTASPLFMGQGRDRVAEKPRLMGSPGGACFGRRLARRKPRRRRSLSSGAFRTRV